MPRQGYWDSQGRYTLTGRMRLRPSWLVFAVLEEEREYYADGTKRWMRATRPWYVQGR